MGREEALEQQEDLHSLFQSLDADADGQLQINEVQAALRRLGLLAGQHYLGDLYSQYDQDQCESIDFEEFKRYVASKEKSIHAVFLAIDVDGDERLDVWEVHRAAVMLGLSVAPEEAEYMITLLDTDKDGKISFLEFQRFCVLLPSSQVSHTNILSAWVDSVSWVSSMEYRLGRVPPTQGLDRSATRLGPVLRRIWVDGGLRGLLHGNMAMVVKTFPSSAIQFAMCDACKDVMQAYSGPGVSDLSMHQKLLASLTAGAAACTATYSLEALRTQVSVAQGIAAGYLTTLRGMAAERGLQGLYQGYSAGLMKDSLSNAMGFASYEAFFTGYRNYYGEQPSNGTKGVLGGSAAFCTMATTDATGKRDAAAAGTGAAGLLAPIQQRVGLRCADAAAGGGGRLLTGQPVVVFQGRPIHRRHPRALRSHHGAAWLRGGAAVPGRRRGVRAFTAPPNVPPHRPSSVSAVLMMLPCAPHSVSA